MLVGYVRVSTNDQNRDLQRLLANGYSRRVIATHYGISTAYKYFPAGKFIDYDQLDSQQLKSQGEQMPLYP